MEKSIFSYSNYNCDNNQKNPCCQKKNNCVCYKLLPGTPGPTGPTRTIQTSQIIGIIIV